MRLFIAEKASLARAIADALPGAQEKSKLSIRCGDDVVIWAAGHLLRQCDPDSYDPTWKKWDLDLLPMIPSSWKKESRSGVSDLLNNIKSMLSKADSVVNCGDADREGQLLIDELLEHFHYAGPVTRLLVTDMNRDAIARSLASMKDNSSYTGLLQAAMARERSDWLLGLNLTRLFTLKAREKGLQTGVISVGRVQTPTLALVVQRDREIETFMPKDYCILAAHMRKDGQPILAHWDPPKDHPGLDEEGRMTDLAAAAALAARLAGKTGQVLAVKRENKSVPPPLPHSLPTLQVECGNKYNLSPAEVLKHLQSLYERKLVTYPRSDCSYVPLSLFAQATQTLAAIQVLCPSLSPVIETADTTLKTAAWDDSKVTEHFAVIPTGSSGSLEGAAEKQVYEEVCRRYIMQFLGDHRYQATTVHFDIDGEQFKATGKVMDELGWRVLAGKQEQEKSEDQKEKQLPALVEKEILSVDKIEQINKKTTPPKHFTEASLLQAMNSIHKYVKDPEIKKVLQDVDGIGTAATQAAIIEALQRREYVKKEKKSLISTSLGRQLIDSVSEECRTPDLTAVWERAMKQIQAGSLSLEDFERSVVQQVDRLVNMGKSASMGFVPGESQFKCPKCGQAMIRRHAGKDGKQTFWACIDRSCRYTCDDQKGKPAFPIDCPICGAEKTLKRRKSQTSGHYWRCTACEIFLDDDNGKPAKTAPCPKCGKVIARKRRKDGKFYWRCSSCGHMCSDDNGKPVVRSV